MVDARDLKSLEATPHAGSSPATGTIKRNGIQAMGPVFSSKRRHFSTGNPAIALHGLKERHGFLVSILTIGVSWGTKEMLLVSEADDKEQLKALFLALHAELPKTKKESDSLGQRALFVTFFGNLESRMKAKYEGMSLLFSGF